MGGHAPVRYEGQYCEFAIASPVPGLVVLTIAGRDVGEFGPAPMEGLKEHLIAGRQVELFIDARRTLGASIEVSSDWALWLRAHRNDFRHISMLARSRFIQITAGFVRSFSGLEDVMRIYTDPAAFDEALAASIGATAATRRST
jgi:hypothetical protein